MGINRKLILENILLAVILIFSFSLRLYRIDNPVADWHSFRQADTSAVSRNFLRYGVDLLHPKFDDLSNIPSGKDNPEGYRFVEFPIYNLFQAITAKSFPQKSLEWWGRMISIIFSLGSIIFLYLIVKKYFGWVTGLLAAIFFGILPFSIYYSRVILPEPMMLFASLGMIYFFINWIEKEKFLYYFLSLVFAATSLLLKPFSAFLFLPLGYLVLRKWGMGSLRKISAYLFFLLAVTPFFLWRIWMSQYPEGIPAFVWLLNEGGIRFKGAFFRWIFEERLGKLILGSWGIIPLALGLIIKPNKKEGWFFHFWVLAILIYFSVIAAGNVQHDYYQIMAIPIICIFLAKGAYFFLFESGTLFSRYLSNLLFVVCFLFMIAFSWYEVRGFFNVNHWEIVEAGTAANKILPPSAKVVAPYEGDTAFLYQINRRGWAAVTNSIESLLSHGATAYVSVNLSDKLTQDLAKQYKILETGKNYIIIDLTHKK